MASIGIKTKAAVAIVILLVSIGSMWLYGSLENQGLSCMKGFRKPVIITILNDTDAYSEEEADMLPLDECPGQDFQVSRLLSQLLAAKASPSDVLLQPYLSSWDELIKFMDSLGSMVGIISKEIEGKTSIIRQLAREDADKQTERPQEEAEREGRQRIHATTDGRRHDGVEEKPGTPTAVATPTEEQGFAGFGESYLSVRSMIRVELRRGTVSFAEQTDSGCRTLLRLHRALLWLQLFLKKLAKNPAAGARPQSPSELCREAYQQTLAHYHSWLVRQAAEFAFLAMPNRGFFFRLLCTQNQEEATSVLNRVVRAIGEVYQRTQQALEDHGMLDLP